MWDKSRPRDRSQIRELTTIMNSQRSAIDDALQIHFHWSDRTSEAGVPREIPGTVATTNSRWFYGPLSEASFSGRDGTGMILSDESRVMVWVNGAPMRVGGSRTIHGRHLTTTVGDFVNWGFTRPPFGARMLVAAGTSVVTVLSATPSGTTTIPFGTEFSAAPQLTITPIADAENPVESAISFTHAIDSISATGFTLAVTYHGPTSHNTSGIMWRASGETEIA